MTFRLQEACSQALGPLPASMPRESATTALKTVRFLGGPFHDSFYAAAPEEDACGGWQGWQPLLECHTLDLPCDRERVHAA